MIRNIKIVNLTDQVCSWYIEIVKIDKTFNRILSSSLGGCFSKDFDLPDKSFNYETN